MMNISIVESQRCLTDLLFQEDKIRKGAIAIAQGFYAIYSQSLWRYRTDENGTPAYPSFEAYCEAEWGGQYSLRSVKGFLTEARYINELEEALEVFALTGTSEAQTGTPCNMLHGVPVKDSIVPVRLAHSRTLRKSGVTVEKQADIWRNVLDQSGGDPRDVTVADIKEQIDKALELSVEDFPIGSPVLIDSGIEGMMYDGYKGHILKAVATKFVEVRASTSDGKTTDIVANVDWLTILDGPLIAVEAPQPRKKPIKKSPLEQWKEDAIALFNKIYLELGEHLPDDTKQKIINLIEK